MLIQRFTPKNPFMKRQLVAIAMVSLLFGSCSVSNRAMQTPNYHIEFYKNDFEYSSQVTAEATMVRVLGIDWSRIFNWNSATISNSNEFSSPNLDVSVGTTMLVDPIVGVVSAIIPVLGDQVKGGVRVVRSLCSNGRKPWLQCGGLPSVRGEEVHSTNFLLETNG
jgi:hypothetical protein